VSLPAALSSGNEIVIVSWVAQTFLQLVLLPIIIVGQNIQAKSSDERAIATYEDGGAILDEAREIQQHLAAHDAAIAELTEQLKKLTK
jgi:prefoldin subunit 5